MRFTQSSAAISQTSLFSCFVNGEAASAIIAVNRDGEDYVLIPLFVSVTDGMILTDHDGIQVSLRSAATGCTPAGRANTLSVDEGNGIEESHAIAKAKGR
jgi:hypothetical protein